MTAKQNWDNYTDAEKEAMVAAPKEQLDNLIEDIRDVVECDWRYASGQKKKRLQRIEAAITDLINRNKIRELKRLQKKLKESTVQPTTAKFYISDRIKQIERTLLGEEG